MDKHSTPGARYGLSPLEKAAVGRRLDQIGKRFSQEEWARIGIVRTNLVNFPEPKSPTILGAATGMFDKYR